MSESIYISADDFVRLRREFAYVRFRVEDALGTANLTFAVRRRSFLESLKKDGFGIAAAAGDAADWTHAETHVLLFEEWPSVENRGFQFNVKPVAVELIRPEPVGDDSGGLGKLALIAFLIFALFS